MNIRRHFTPIRSAFYGCAVWTGTAGVGIAPVSSGWKILAGLVISVGSSVALTAIPFAVMGAEGSGVVRVEKEEKERKGPAHSGDSADPEVLIVYGNEVLSSGLITSENLNEILNPIPSPLDAGKSKKLVRVYRPNSEP